MKGKRRCPWVSLILFCGITLICLLAPWISPYDVNAMDSSALHLAPCLAHPLGTDSMGRDLLTRILYGGRASICIGLLATGISTALAVVYGTISGVAGEKVDVFLMRLAELYLSIPSILLILFFQAMWGKASYFSLAVVIGVTSWPSIAKVVRSEVRQIGESDYILAARTMGAGFGYVLGRHLLPNFFSSILFMVVSNMGQAMITESTLSFLGLGLPLTMPSWGSLLSQSQSALLTGYWWIVWIPGVVMVTTLVCITQLGEYMRKKNNRIYSNL